MSSTKSLEQIKSVRIHLINIKALLATMEWPIYSFQQSNALQITFLKYRQNTATLPPKIFRLCTGHCQLNKHLHKLGLHLDGHCDTCGTPETVEPFLVHCSKFNNQRTELTSNIRALQINFDWITLLRTSEAQRSILTDIKQTGKPVW